MMLASTRQVLFNPGPVNLHPAIKDNLFNVELCHRQGAFEELDEHVRKRLHDAAGLTSEEYRLSLLHGSGTLAVDAALATLVRGDVLVIENGVYGRRFADTLERVPGASPVVYEPGVGRPPDLAELEREIERRRPDWLAVVHHETTTGLLNPLEAIAELARRHGARMFVDAVSSLGAHPVDDRADVVCFNSNKCLESLPGIAGVFWRRDLEPHETVPVLDVSAYADAIPSTPHVQAFVALDIALDLLAAEDRPERYRRLARRVWESGAAAGFEPLLPEGDRSHVLTSFRLGGWESRELIERALASGYVIYAGQGRLRDEIFRVANMGAAIDERVIDDLFEVLSA